MRHPVSTYWRAERRAASRQSRLAFVPSKPTQVGSEPRHSPPKPAVRRHGQSPGLSVSGLTPSGDRPMYATDEGLS